MKFHMAEDGNVRYFVIIAGKLGDGSRLIVDFSKIGRECWEHDGNQIGVSLAYEIERAKEYAEYVSRHVTSDTVEQFNTNKYTILIESDIKEMEATQ